MYNFEVFTGRGFGRGGKARLTAYVTLCRTSFRVSGVAVDLLGTPDAVELLFDPVARIVGFRPIDENVHHAYRLRPMAHQSARDIAGRAFFREYGIRIEESVRCDAEMVAGVLCIQVPAEVIRQPLRAVAS